MDEDLFALQMSRMRGFLDHEAREKSNEIVEKTEDEYHATKGYLIHSNRIRIMNMYDQMEKKLVRKRAEFLSRLFNKERIKVSEAKDSLLKDIYSQVEEAIKRRVQIPSLYERDLYAIILQGLVVMSEDSVRVIVREEDLALASSMMVGLKADYIRLTNKPERFVIKLSRKKYLPEEALGGALLTSNRGTILTENTLQKKLEFTFLRAMPLLGSTLFRKSNFFFMT